MQLYAQPQDSSPELSMMNLMRNDNPDNELWKAFQSGDRSAFETIYNNSIEDLTNYAMRIASDKDIVQDAIQDIFVHLWNKRGELGSVSSIKFYLLKSVRRDVIKKLVKSKKKSPLTSLNKAEIDFQPSYEMVKIHNEESAERIMKMRKELELLTPRQKEVLYLKYYSNMTNQEISEILEINIQSVYNNIYRGLEVLRDKLHTVLPWFIGGVGSFGI